MIVKLGVGVLIFNEKGQILLGKRAKSYGFGCWSFPGGHLEFGETVYDCARREVQEETNLLVDNFVKGPYTEDFLEEDKHYITLYVKGKIEPNSPELINMEPEKTSEWGWFDLKKLPEPLWLPVELLLHSVHMEQDFKVHNLIALI